jgi:hypothetical protein
MGGDSYDAFPSEDIDADHRNYWGRLALPQMEQRYQDCALRCKKASARLPVEVSDTDVVLDMSCPMGALRRYLPRGSWVDAVDVLPPARVGEATSHSLVHYPYNLRHCHPSWAVRPKEMAPETVWLRPGWYSLILGRMDLHLLPLGRQYCTQYLTLLRRDGILLVTEEAAHHYGLEPTNLYHIELPCGEGRWACLEREALRSATADKEESAEVRKGVPPL